MSCIVQYVENVGYPVPDVPIFGSSKRDIAIRKASCVPESVSVCPFQIGQFIVAAKALALFAPEVTFLQRSQILSVLPYSFQTKQLNLDSLFAVF